MSPVAPADPQPVGLATILVLLLAAAALAVGATGIPVRFPFNLNEGWNALHAVDAMSGRNPYVPDGYANYLNYLPIWFYLTGWLGNLFGDHVMVGRAIALLSQLVVAINIARAAAALGANRNGALLAAGLFILFGALAAPNYLAMNDPQWLAHAVQSFALVLLLQSEKISPGRLVAIFGLLLAGGLVKHNLTALPLAVTLWLALRDRKALTIWFGVGAVTLPVLAMLGYLAFGPDLFAQVFGHRRLIDPSQLLVAPEALLFLAPFVLIAGFTAWRTQSLLPRLYLVTALVFGVLFGLGVGVHANTWFDLSIAVLPLVGLAATRSGFGGLAWVKSAPRSHLLSAALALAVVLALLPRGAGYFALRLDAPRAAVELQPVIAQLAAATGPVACEDPTFCYWAGKPNAIDMINLGARLTLDQVELIHFSDWIKARPVALIQLYGSRTGRLPPEANDAIARNYQTIVTSPVTLYAPQ